MFEHVVTCSAAIFVPNFMTFRLLVSWGDREVDAMTWWSLYCATLCWWCSKFHLLTLSLLSFI